MPINSNQLNHVQFLKLGGSLITDKRKPHTPRIEVIQRIAGEIANACQEFSDLRLVLGHGSGSFGHVPAKRWGTRQGVRSPLEWKGFVEVWQEAEALNHLVIDALHASGVSALSFSPLSAVTSKGGIVLDWNIEPIRSALEAGLIPVIHGDVVFDLERGGTILSTEDLFDYLAKLFRPKRISLAGIEPGVWADYPSCTRLIQEISPDDLSKIESSLGGSAATDVTGGMSSKVIKSLELVKEIPGLEIQIFSGEEPGAVQAVLGGAILGSILHAS